MAATASSHMARPGTSTCFVSAASFLLKSGAAFADGGEKVEGRGADFQKDLPAVPHHLACRLVKFPPHGLHLLAGLVRARYDAAEADVQVMRQDAQRKERGVGGAG